MNQSNPMTEQTQVINLESQMPPQPKLTIEQEEERKLRSKYPNPQKPGGSAFIQKMLHKGSKKYFDSGDYNMAKSKKQGLLNGLNKGGNPLPPSASTPTVNTNMNNQTSTPVSQIRSESMTQSFNSNNTNTNTNNSNNTNNASTDQVMSVSDVNSPCVNVSNTSSDSNTTPYAVNVTPSIQNNNNSSNNSMNTQPSEIPKPCTPNQKQAMNTQMNENTSTNTNNTNSNFLNTSNTTSPLSASISINNIQNNQNYLNPMALQSSQSSQSISLLSSSISSDKIAQIQINQQQMLDSEEIGHGIPTPECLPQSRKHSIVQSKLATPRLSSS